MHGSLNFEFGSLNIEFGSLNIGFETFRFYPRTNRFSSKDVSNLVNNDTIFMYISKNTNKEIGTPISVIIQS